MNNHRQCPIPARGFKDCWATPHPDSKFGLCDVHWRKVAKDLFSGAIYPEFKCSKCKLFSLRTVPGDNMRYCTNRKCATIFFDIETDDGGHQATTKEHKDFLPPKKSPRHKDQANVVYYIIWADRIKIGTTTNLPNRMESVYHDEILAIEPGDAQLESRRHAQFAEYKIHGQREWFSAAPGLRFFANTLRDTHGEPLKAWRHLCKEEA